VQALTIPYDDQSFHAVFAILVLQRQALFTTKYLSDRCIKYHLRLTVSICMAPSFYLLVVQAGTDNMVLRIKKKDLDNIFLQAGKCYPFEACGIFVGKRIGGEKDVGEVYHTKNVLTSSAYQIDPIEQLKIFEKAELQGLDVLGFYHSHPSCDSFWSEIDDERGKLWIGYSYLIVSLKTLSFNSYVRRKDRVEKEEIKIL